MRYVTLFYRTRQEAGEEIGGKGKGGDFGG